MPLRRSLLIAVSFAFAGAPVAAQTFTNQDIATLEAASARANEEKPDETKEEESKVEEEEDPAAQPFYQGMWGTSHYWAPRDDPSSRSVLQRNLLRFDLPDQDRCSNLYAARFDVPFGRYDGNAIFGYDPEGSTGVPLPDGNVVFGGIFAGVSSQTDQDPVAGGTRTDQSHYPASGGWFFEPNGLLFEEWTTQAADLITCRAVQRFTYVSGSRSIRFQARGVESACVYNLAQGTPEADLHCQVELLSNPNHTCLVQQSQFWSTDGQIALDLSDRTHPTVRFPDGMIEVMRAGGPYSGRPFGWFDGAPWVSGRTLDRNGNMTKYEYDANGLATTVTDQRGRVTTFSRDGRGRVTSVSKPGAGGLPATWTLTWRDLSYEQNVTFPDLRCHVKDVRGVFVGDAPCPAKTLTLRTLDRITLPDHLAGQAPRTLRFSYEPWGGLKQAFGPDGAITTFVHGGAGAPIRQAPYGYAERDCPGDFRGPDVPGNNVVIRRSLLSQSVQPNGGAAFTTTFTSGAEQSLPFSGDRGGCSKLRWEITHFPDGHSLEEAFCFENAHPRRVRSPRTYWWSANGAEYGLNDHVMVQRVRDAMGSLLAEHSYIDLATGVPRFSWELASTELPGTAYLDIRSTRVEHQRDGVSWAEVMQYDGSSIAAVGGARTLGNITVGKVLDGLGAVLRQTVSTYETSAGYLARNLIRLPRHVEVKSASAVLQSTDHRYDQFTPLATATGLNPARLEGPPLITAERGNLTELKRWALLDASSVLTHTHYRVNGAVESVDDPGDALGTRHTTRTTADFYDCATRPVAALTVTNPLGHTTTRYCDCWSGLELATVDPNGQLSCAQYDQDGRVVELAGPGDMLSSLPLAGQAVSYLRYAGCPVTGATTLGSNGAGPTTWTQYLRLGVLDEQRVVTLRRNGGAGHASVTFLDGLGRTVQTLDALDPLATQGGFAAAAVTTTYDAMGRVSEVTVPFGATLATRVTAVPVTTRSTRSSYDALGRVVAVTTPSGTTTTRHEAAGAAVWLTTVTNANGNESRTTTNALDQQVLSEQARCATQGSGCTFAQGIALRTELTVDALGRVTGVKDPRGNVTTIVFDGLGRKRSMRDPDMGLWQYSYDPDGNLTQQVDANLQTLTLKYDGLHRLTLKNLPPAAPGEEDEVYTYDGARPTCGCGGLPGQVCCSTTCDPVAVVCLGGTGGGGGSGGGSSGGAGGGAGGGGGNGSGTGGGAGTSCTTHGTTAVDTSAGSVRVTDSATLGFNGAITVEAWVKRTANNDQVQRIAHKQTTGGGFSLRLNADGTVRFSVFDSSGAVSHVSSATVIPLNVWTHVAGVRTAATAGGMRVWVGGVAGTTCVPANCSSTFAPGSANLLIGAADGAGTDRFTGRIDEVRLSATARYLTPFTPASPLAASAAVCTDPATRGYWKFENAGTLDSSASGNHGTPLGALAFVPDNP